MAEGNGRTIADVVEDVVASVQSLMRAEFRLAKTEISEEASKAGRAAGLLAGGGVAALFTIWLLLLTILFALATVIPIWSAALLLFIAMAATTRVEEATDWRIQFQKRPLLMVSAAAGGGLLLAAVSGRRSKSRHPYVDESAVKYREHQRGTELQKNKALETFDTIKGAMIGVAANAFKDLLGQLVPGFSEQFQKTAREKGMSAPSNSAAASASPR